MIFFIILPAGGNYCGTNIPVWMKGESQTLDKNLSDSDVWFHLVDIPPHFCPDFQSCVMFLSSERFQLLLMKGLALI